MGLHMSWCEYVSSLSCHEIIKCFVIRCHIHFLRRVIYLMSLFEGKVKIREMRNWVRFLQPLEVFIMHGVFFWIGSISHERLYLRSVLFCCHFNLEFQLQWSLWDFNQNVTSRGKSLRFFVHVLFEFCCCQWMSCIDSLWIIITTGQVMHS